jgi:prephenate dehydrogenase
LQKLDVKYRSGGNGGLFVKERAGTVCIVGLGLMGGSLALALREAYGVGAGIVGVARRPDALDKALACGAINKGTPDLKEGMTGAETVVLATPVRTILRQLPLVGASADPGTLVLDLGSSKSQICAAMGELPAGLHPVGGHPMCGKEVTGFAAAEAGLFRNRPFVLCPLPRTDPEALERAVSLVNAIGAHPIVLDPAVHDRAVAGISHLPYAAAAALVNCVDAAEDSVVWSLASSGFRDTSRLAGSDVDMMLDILLTNRAAVVDWLGRYAVQLDELKFAVATEDEVRLRKLLAAAQHSRARRAF